MLVLFVTDLHGEVLLYEKLLCLIEKRKPSLILFGGDLLPKSSEGGNLYLLQQRFIRGEFTTFFEKIYHRKHSVDIGIMLGNDDFLSLREELFLLETRGFFNLIDGRKRVTLSGWHVIGFNLIPETPFSLKDLERKDCKEDNIQYPLVHAVCSAGSDYKVTDAQNWFVTHSSLSEELTYLPPVVEPKQTIFVSHAPPYGTPLDISIEEKHVGSRSIRNYIQHNQPYISLHGHIHESFYMSGIYAAQLGNTICFNPGQIHYPILDAILFDIDDPMYNREHTGNSAPLSKEGLKLLKPPFETKRLKS